MDFNYNYFYLKNHNITVLDFINNTEMYYSVIYGLFTNEISFEEFKSKILCIFNNNLEEEPNIYSKILLKIFSYIIKKHLSDFDVCNYNVPNENFINIFVYNLSNDINIDNTLYDIYIQILKDENKIIYYYYKYYQNIFENLDLNLYPIEIIILDKNKFEIYEGSHRFIFAYIKKIKPYFIIKDSTYDLFNNIISRRDFN